MAVCANPNDQRGGMAVRYEGQIYRVIEAEYHGGQGKMGGATHARLKNLSTGALWEHSFRSDLKIEDLPVEKQPMNFLYADGGECWFMNPRTFEQAAIPADLIGPQAAFLQPEIQLPVEYVNGEALGVLFPEIIDVRIADTAPPLHQQQDNTWKPGKLENGVEIMVPQFIKTGDLIRLDMQTLKYLERAKAELK